MEKEFLSLIQENIGIIYKIILMYSNTNEYREDLKQEIIFQLWKSYPSFNHQSLFTTFMYRVSLNTGINYYKKENKNKYESIDLYCNTLDATPDRHRELEAFYAAIYLLAPLEKAIIFYYLEGFDYSEISLKTNLSEGNIRVKMYRIKEKLKNILNT